MKRTISLYITIALTGLASLLAHASAVAEPMPLRLNVIVHQEVPGDLRTRLQADYLQRWVEEMEKVTGREVEIRFNDNVPGVSDMVYTGENRQVVRSIIERANQAAWQKDGNYRRDKTLLLVMGGVRSEGSAAEEVLGEAVFQGSSGWASLKTYTAAGHELGHMFGATHENAEVLYNGWWCETYTYPVRQNLRSNCYRYSDLNRQAIRAYLSEVP